MEIVMLKSYNSDKDHSFPRIHVDIKLGIITTLLMSDILQGSLIVQMCMGLENSTQCSTMKCYDQIEKVIDTIIVLFVSFT